MGTTNILDLNNRVDEMEKSYPAAQVMMSDGTTSVEDVVDGLTESIANVGNLVPSPTFNNGTVTAQGQSYITLFDTLPAGTWIITLNYVTEPSTNAIITDDRPWSTGRFGELGDHGGAVSIFFASPTTVRLFVNSEDTTTKTFHRALARAIRVK